MTDKPAAMAAVYADAKFIKTRSTLQVVLEFPIEAADAFFAAFGTPQPSRETWVAVARMNVAPVKASAALPPPTVVGQVDDGSADESVDEFDGGSHNRAREAAMLASDSFFQAFLIAKHGWSVATAPKINRESAADAVRSICSVKSRSEFDKNRAAAARWDRLHGEFSEYVNAKM